MHQISKAQAVSVFEDIARLMELKGENPFKIRAYQNGARALEAEPGELNELIESGKLDHIKGIGEALRDKIRELAQTGKLEFLDRLKASVPQGLLELVELPGIGPKKARHLHDDLGIHSIGELEYACQENRLVKLKGFGAKSQENILKAIQFYRKSRNRFLYPDALHEAEALVAELKKIPTLEKIEIAGSLRRRREIIGDIDLVATSRSPQRIIDSFVDMADQIINQGDTKASVKLKSGIQADLLCMEPQHFPFTLHHFTGSKEHNIALRSRAHTRGLKLNEYGLFNEDQSIPCKDEEEIYRHLGLHYIPPELREDLGEIEAAEKRGFQNLISLEDLQGTFHMHTLYSDGNATVKDMAAAAKKRGLHYIGISDHSQSAFYAHGMKPADIEAQHREIDEINKNEKDFKIFKGVESDILADGSLDYDEEVLEKFDFVIASVHSRFKMNEEEMTERIVKALKNPYTTMLGHMTGRLLLSREPYALNIRKIIDTAAEYQKIIELNCNPYRLDIDWRHLDYARSQGVKISINPDAHRPEGFDDLAYGIAMARKGGLTRKDVVNTMNLAEIGKFLMQ